MAENKVVHAAQRAAFSVAIDAAIKAVRGKGTEHMTEEAVKLINLAEPLLSKLAKLESVRVLAAGEAVLWISLSSGK